MVIPQTADLGICKRHNLVEIAEASWREADACIMDPAAVDVIFTVEVLVPNPASPQPVEAEDTRLLPAVDVISTVD